MLFRYLYRQSATTASVTHGLVRDTKLKPCTSKKKVCKEKVKRELTENQKKAHLKRVQKQGRHLNAGLEGYARKRYICGLGSGAESSSSLARYSFTLP